MTKQWKNPPPHQIDAKKTYLVTMDTELGAIELELYPQHAPKTVNNFIFLFFITRSPQPHLDGKHTVFGKVISGQDVVSAIRQGDTMIRVTVRDE